MKVKVDIAEVYGVSTIFFDILVWSIIYVILLFEGINWISIFVASFGILITFFLSYIKYRLINKRRSASLKRVVIIDSIFASLMFLSVFVFVGNGNTELIVFLSPMFLLPLIKTNKKIPKMYPPDESQLINFKGSVLLKTPRRNDKECQMDGRPCENPENDTTPNH